MKKVSYYRVAFSTLKVRASEQESSLIELLPRAQPKLNDKVINSQPSTLLHSLCQRIYDLTVEEVDDAVGV